MTMAANIFRLFKIQWIWLRHGLDEIVFKLPILVPFKFIFYLSPWNWFGKREQPLACRIRYFLEDLGPLFVKFGQALSTRRDLLPTDVADELAKLQDKVPPFPGEQARLIVERSLGASVEEVFQEFDNQPLASASVAQVHAARLHNGAEVVVKVLRPKIAKEIRRDIDLLYFLARMLYRWWSEGRRLNPLEVVEEYEKTILNELDLLREAANASQLRRNFEDSDLLYVPEVYWSYCRKDVMVMERIYGIPVSDIKGLREAGMDLEKLSDKGVEIFFTQVFEHNFFHADMHPGNIFVARDHPENPRYLGVDFGIIGTLSDSDQRYLAENFLAFFRHDYRRVADLHIESGWVPKDTRADEFEAAIRTVCEPIFQRPLNEISFGNLLLRLFQTARQFNMEVQPQLILLQKTLLNIEGLGRQLYPDLDLWKTAKPFFERWVAKRNSPRALLTRLLRDFPKTVEALPQLPERVTDNLAQIQSLQERMEKNNRQFQTALSRMQKYLIVSIAVLAVAVTFALWYD